ncbi:MAG TPA: histidine kinase, partial [Longimicrobium sp.]
GVGVWHATGIVELGVRRRPPAAAAHVVLAALYAGIWIGSIALRIRWQAGPDAAARFLASPGTGWQVFSGMWLYGVIAGISHLVRVQRREAGQREALADAHARRVHAEALRTRSELQSLRARLNPHFLFNTLHSLRILVRRDPDAARDAIDRLADLLRHVLDGAGETAVVPLRREVQFVEAYLGLERVRFGDRLRVRTTVDPEALDALVPSLLLQPLVENAILHGIEPQAGGGTVELSLVLRGDEVVISVSDDGVGADAPPGAGGPGLGLVTARQRLQLHYGGRAGFHVHTSPRGGFRVVVTIPAEGPAEPMEASLALHESATP